MTKKPATEIYRTESVYILHCFLQWKNSLFFCRVKIYFDFYSYFWNLQTASQIQSSENAGKIHGIGTHGTYLIGLPVLQTLKLRTKEQLLCHSLASGTHIPFLLDDIPVCARKVHVFQ